MNFNQLQALLTGSFLKVHTDDNSDVLGYQIPGADAGGALLGYRRPNRFIYPGFNDGSYGFQRKRKRTTYSSNLERRAHELQVNPHIAKRRQLESDLRKKKKRKTVQPEPLPSLEPIPEMPSVSATEEKIDPEMPSLESAVPAVETSMPSMPEEMPIEEEKIDPGIPSLESADAPSVSEIPSSVAGMQSESTDVPEPQSGYVEEARAKEITEAVRSAPIRVTDTSPISLRDDPEPVPAAEPVAEPVAGLPALETSSGEKITTDTPEATIAPTIPPYQDKVADPIATKQLKKIAETQAKKAAHDRWAQYNAPPSGVPVRGTGSVSLKQKEPTPMDIEEKEPTPMDIDETQKPTSITDLVEKMKSLGFETKKQKMSISPKKLKLLPKKQTLERAITSVSYPVKDQPKLEAKTSAISAPVKTQPKLEAKTSSISAPVKRQPKLEAKTSAFSAPTKKIQPVKLQAKTAVSKGDVKVHVTPTQTQKVTVAPSTGSIGSAALEKKIDELLRSQKEAKRTKLAKKAFTAAKKQYRQYRKKHLTDIKKQNKEIKKRELAKIRRVPADQRAKMRKDLAEKLKLRVDAIKKRLPAKISTPGQLRELMSKTLTV